jgi:hypothetical protein
MEWKFSDVERQHMVVLEPQAPIELGTGTFFTGQRPLLDQQRVGGRFLGAHFECQ